MFYKFHGVRALIWHDGKLLILRRASAETSDPGLWDLPGGKIESDETAVEAIQREVLEEAGIGADMLNIKDLYGLILAKFDSKDKLVIAVFNCESQTELVKLNSEHSKYDWIDSAEVAVYDTGRILRELPIFKKKAG